MEQKRNVLFPEMATATTTAPTAAASTLIRVNANSRIGAFARMTEFVVAISLPAVVTAAAIKSMPRCGSVQLNASLDNEKSWVP